MSISIRPVVAPTLTGLTIIPTLKGNLIVWDALVDAALFAVEIWTSQTNDRATATLLATVQATNHYLTAGLVSGAQWFHWIRAKNIYGRADGAWTPSGATSGTSATTLFAQTADIAPNATRALTSTAAINSGDTQTAYATYESRYFKSYNGTGNVFLLDVNHLALVAVTAIATTQSAFCKARLKVVDNTCYRTGTVTTTNGSAIVTGSGTAWLANLTAGQAFFVNAPGELETRYTILSVDTNLQITLTATYAGLTGAGKAYGVITASVDAWNEEHRTAEFVWVGTHVLTFQAPFNVRPPLPSTLNHLYDIVLEWRMDRDNVNWALTQTEVSKSLIIEEAKR